MERHLRPRDLTELPETISMTAPELPDVFSAAEIARAAGVGVRDVRDLAASGAIQPAVPGGRFYAAGEAVFAVRSLRGQAPAAERALFRPVHGVRREPGLPLAVSGALHVALAAGLILLATLGIAKPEAHAVPEDRND